MKEISRKLIVIFSGVWLIYFFYSIGVSIYDANHVKRTDWSEARNISSNYNGYKATIVTSAFQKGNVKIERSYGYFTQGLSVFLWKIDKEAPVLDISFYVKDADFRNVKSNTPSYRNLLFSDKKKVSPVAFFGLRKIGESPSAILLFLDLWKYNYSLGISLLIMFLPIPLVIIIKKIFNHKNFELEEMYNIKGHKRINQIFILFLATLFLRFLV
ncbi:hypothetical protein EG347_19595 [Chryseobacterium sp. G0186]|uniref:hypothetical protein n=1 Tax=Chryseobacterium sp. G0186 TaxID=2487064 RepID=UPI000F50FA48|nr:hypothetical protein [Chryseobacterium sp. G0186]AZA79546.1 hypothetical protein EG347_19595 [Chryseobacterium sp. G0186]